MCVILIRRIPTPFFPGIPHSQFMRFMVPSGFLVGTATKPFRETNKIPQLKTVIFNRNYRLIEQFARLRSNIWLMYIWVSLTKGWSFLQALRSCDSLLKAIPDMTQQRHPADRKKHYINRVAGASVKTQIDTITGLLRIQRYSIEHTEI